MPAATEPLAWFALYSDAALDMFRSLKGLKTYEGHGVDQSGTIEAYATFASKKTMESVDKQLRKCRLGELTGFVL
jgi:hypothetical protein